MTTKERILSIRVMAKACRNPQYVEKLGITIRQPQKEDFVEEKKL